jgi:hypothetical protein
VKSPVQMHLSVPKTVGWTTVEMKRAPKMEVPTMVPMSPPPRLPQPTTRAKRKRATSFVMRNQCWIPFGLLQRLQHSRMQSSKSLRWNERETPAGAAVAQKRGKAAVPES